MLTSILKVLFTKNPNQKYLLKVEEYVSSLEKLTTDMRFTLYNILYKRILVIWIFSAFMVLIGILFRCIICNSGSSYLGKDG